MAKEESLCAFYRKRVLEIPVNITISIIFENNHKLIKLIFFRNLNIYEACVPDRMHHIDLGLFKYQLEFIQDILKEVRGVNLQKEFDSYLRQISHFSGLKLISNLGRLNVITAADYRHIMKIAFFALDGI